MCSKVIELHVSFEHLVYRLILTQNILGEELFFQKRTILRRTSLSCPDKARHGPIFGKKTCEGVLI